MATDYKAHLAQWKHNRGLIAHIPPGYPDWIVTVAFYAALHVVDALLIKDKNREVQDHAGRNSVLMETNRYSQIWRLYYPLYNLARTVRYVANPDEWIPARQIEQKVLGRLLYPIERSAIKLLGLPDESQQPVTLFTAAGAAANVAQ